MVRRKIAAICRRQQLTFHLVCLGLGTASSEILDWFGLGETDKDVVLTLASSQKVSAMLSIFSDELQIKRPGKGIAFSIPLSGIAGSLLQALSEESTPLEKEGTSMEESIKFELVIAVVNPGYCDQAVSAARGAGATGGTAIHARDVSHESAENFWHLHSAGEEIVAILIKKEIKQAVMQAVNLAVGAKTPAKGLIFALPVDDLIGLTLK
ncbi:MAG: hypothetical protein ACLR23_18200 [Clostridia bacterium]